MSTKITNQLKRSKNWSLLAAILKHHKLNQVHQTKKENDSSMMLRK